MGISMCACKAYLRPIEHAELIHVIPDVQVLSGALVLVEHELLGPPVPRGRVEVVWVGGGARPAPPAPNGDPTSVPLLPSSHIGVKVEGGGLP